MKNWNVINKCFLGILILTLVAIIIKIVNYRSWDRYYYSSSISAPANFPVYVKNSYFILEDGDYEYITTSAVNDGQYRLWGEPADDDAPHKLRLPVKLVLQYASYRDSLFYRDTLDLPKAQIRELFEKTDKNGIPTNSYGSPRVKRLDFVVGLANKGYVVVWLRNIHEQRVLLKTKLNSVKPRDEDTYYSEVRTVPDYFDHVFYIDSALLADFKKGLDSGANYIDTPSKATPDIY